MPLHVHPTDARIKCLTKEQVQQLAAAHGRPIELPPALASSPLVQACPQGMLETPRIRLSGLLVSFSFFFRFVGQQGRFSAYRKGRMSRGWSAYRTIHQHDYQHYLGTTDHLTIDCLEQMAAKLQFHMRSLSFAEPCPVLSSLYSKLRTSPLDTGLEQGYTCSIQLLNAPGKVYLFHPARPIEKARTSLAPFLSGTDHERVALRAPQYKGSRAQEPGIQRGVFLMWYVGIDWANDHHDALVIDEKGRQVGSLRVDHSPQGLSRLNTFLEQIMGDLSSKDQIACIIETTHGLLITHLLEAGWPVYPVNPRTVDRRRAASGAKTDTIDAYLLAKTGRADLTDLHRLTPDSEKITELKLLTRDQDALIRMQTRLVNQLTACLKAYYPVALELFAKLHQKSTLLFLQTYPTPQEAMGASTEQIKEVLRRAKHSNPTLGAVKIFERLHRPHLQADAVTTRTKSRLMLVLVSQLQPLIEQIAQYDKEIDTLFLTHEDHEIFESLPRAGKRLAPRLLAEIGDDRERYQDASSLQALGGTSPVLFQSGMYSKAHRRLGCIKPLRNAVQQFAWQTTQSEPWARDYYQRKRAEGKSHTVAVRALANVWVRIIFAMWVHHQCYETTTFEQAQRQHARKAA